MRFDVEKVKADMARFGITQDQMVRSLGWGKSTLSSGFLRGELSESKVKQLASALFHEEDYYMLPGGRVDSTPPTTEGVSSEDFNILLLALDKIVNKLSQLESNQKALAEELGELHHTLKSNNVLVGRILALQENRKEKQNA